jgi:hypothetical protein
MTAALLAGCAHPTGTVGQDPNWAAQRGLAVVATSEPVEQSVVGGLAYFRITTTTQVVVASYKSYATGAKIAYSCIDPHDLAWRKLIETTRYDDTNTFADLQKFEPEQPSPNDTGPVCVDNGFVTSWDTPPTPTSPATPTQAAKSGA